MIRPLALLSCAIAAVTAAPAVAQRVVYETVSETVESAEPRPAGAGGERLVAATTPSTMRGIATFGPFRVLDASHAALVDETDAATPGEFAAMLTQYPGIATLELIECPGTEDDRANLKLGRMIHARGLSTDVPDGGSVRSGGVELFLAGVRHTAAAGAEFAVHSWADEDGREARDYPADAPENQAYLTYYQEMGMTKAEAASFYAMTNSVPFAEARWLTAADMGRWVALD